MKCRYCGADLRPDDKFCPKCGARNIEYKESGDIRTPIAVLLIIQALTPL